MKNKQVALAVATVALVLSIGMTVWAQQDRYTLQVPGGLAFSEFRGYDTWQIIGPSYTEGRDVLRVILGNPVIIQAYQQGLPANGKPFPDGSKMAKIEWHLKKITDHSFSEAVPDTVPGALTEVEFSEKDSKRFADGNGWGYAVFKYDAATDRFTPGTAADTPPQGNDAKCGTACHRLASATDFVFTAYPKR